jgi:hypothetical protein
MIVVKVGKLSIIQLWLKLAHGHHFRNVSGNPFPRLSVSVGYGGRISGALRSFIGWVEGTSIN